MAAPTVEGDSPTFRVTRQQVEKLRDAAYDGGSPQLHQRDDLLITLLYEAGVPPGTLVKLDVEHVSEDRTRIFITDGQQGDSSGRKVELDPGHSTGTRRLLAAYLDNRIGDREALFPSRKADRLTVRGVRYVVDRLAERATVRPYTVSGDRGEPGDVTPQVLQASGPVTATQSTERTSPPPREPLESPGDPAPSRLVDDPPEGWSPPPRGPIGLEQGEALLDRVFDTIVDLSYVLDTNGRFRHWNDRLPEVTGYTDDEVADRHALEFVAPEDRESIAEAMAEVFETGTIETREASLLTKEGDRIPYEFNGAPITVDGEVQALAGVGRDLSDRRERERELERYRRTVNAVGDGIYQLDAAGTLVAVNDVIVEVTGYSREELLGEHVSMLLSTEDIQGSLEVIRDLLAADGEEVGSLEVTVETKAGETIPAEARIATVGREEEFEGTVGVVRDISERKAREQKLARQRDELAQLNRINAVIRDVDRALVRATEREEIEEAVCENLVDNDTYRFAWIGDYVVGSDRIEPRTWAGVEEGYLSERPGRNTLADDDVTAGTAYQEDEVQIARNIADNPAFASWREAALERGYRSAIAVPLTYRDARHGVLCVYAPRPDAFDERECTVLRELGETIAHALSAVERRRALATDTVVELELAVRDPDVVLIALSDRAGCTIELEGTVPDDAGGISAFVTAVGVDKDAITDNEASLEARVDVIEAQAGECLLRVDGAASPVTELADHGGTVRSAVAEGGEMRLTVEFPPDVSVRTVVEALSRRYDSIDVLARREGKRREMTGTEFRAEVDESVTDRQREVLEAAHLSGFFEWPRGSNGQEVAAVLGIATPTFHQHIRAATGKLVTTYLDG